MIAVKRIPSLHCSDSAAGKIINMNKNKPFDPAVIGVDWATQSKQMQRKFVILTDADMTLEKGKENELIDRIIFRLHKKRKEVVAMIRKGEMWRL